MQRSVIRTSLTALLLTMLLTAPAAAQTADKDCDNFATQAEAQTYFKANGGSTANNVDDLDRDRDDIACEALPGGSGSTEATSSDTGAVAVASDTQAEQGETLPYTGTSTSQALTIGLAGALLLAAGASVVWRLRHRPSH